MKRLSPLHKLLVRTNGLLSVDRIAGFLGVTPDVVRGWLQELGLPDTDVLDFERAFPLLMRRTHDILSDGDVARLLGMSEEQCRQATMDMDFLDVKLGGKPESIPSMDVSASDIAQVAQVFREYAGPYLADHADWERPFSFLESFSDIESSAQTGVEPQDVSGIDLRMMYSYTATHGDFLLTGEDFYSEAILSRLRNRSVNAGWMPAILRDMAPSSVFPEFGKGHEIRLANLKKQVEQAAKYGIRIFLYFNEPRFMPGEFFEKYPECRGMQAHKSGYYGMCTSDERVRQWLRESTEFVFRAVPGLGGVVLITASEYETNCYSHRYEGSMTIDDGLGLIRSEPMCPKCEQRGPQVVLADTATLMNEGVQAAGSDAQVIQWFWGWDSVMGTEGIKEAIRLLPKQVAAMVDWAKHTTFEVQGKKAQIGEYTLAYVTPSEFAQELIKTAKEFGLKVYSRCALATTVEMNALPYLPVFQNVETLIRSLREWKVDGLLGCWIFGGYPGRSMEMLGYRNDEHPAQSLALKYYGEAADEALRAWECFSNGMKYFPTIVSVLYGSALNPGPGLRFPLDPEPWRYGMVAMATEQIEEMSQPLGSEAVIWGFRQVAESFSDGLAHLRTAVADSDRAEWTEENARDYRICQACMHHLVSAANYSEFILVRNKWLENPGDQSVRGRLLEIMHDELENSKAMLNLAKQDSRIGYEGAIGYFYTPMEIIEKMYDLQCGIEDVNAR